jgi:hypothetical protein
MQNEDKTRILQSFGIVAIMAIVIYHSRLQNGKDAYERARGVLEAYVAGMTRAVESEAKRCEAAVAEAEHAKKTLREVFSWMMAVVAAISAFGVLTLIFIIFAYYFYNCYFYAIFIVYLYCLFCFVVHIDAKNSIN